MHELVNDRAGKLRAAIALGAAFTLACTLFPASSPEDFDSHPGAETPKPADDLYAPLRAETSSVRGLEFMKAVPILEIERDEVPALVRFELSEAQPPDYAMASRDAYAALGVLPVDIDLIDTWLALHHDQLIGMYSPSRRTMFVVIDPAQLDTYEDGVTVRHEMIHALQHQHFEQTVALLRGLRRNDDVLAALSAVMEGDAFLSMFARSEGNKFKRSVETAERLRQGMLVSLSDPTGELAAVPRLIRASLVFPYAHGVVTAARAYQGEGCSSWLPVELWAPSWCRGNRGLDLMLENPPLSTASVLFPERRERVAFVGLPLLALEEETRDRGCKLGLDNVMGSMTLEVLLEDFGVANEEIDALLPALRGDRFVYLSCPEGREFAWLSLWDDPASAKRFARVYDAIAPEVAADRLSGAPEVLTSGRTALVLTRGLRGARNLILAGSEIREYSTFGEWVEDDCFPESPCPTADDGMTSSLRLGSAAVD